MGTVNAWTSKETEQKLQEYCKSNNCNKSTAINRALDSFLLSKNQISAHDMTERRNTNSQPIYPEQSDDGYIDFPVCPNSGLKFVMGRIASEQEIEEVLSQ